MKKIYTFLATGLLTLTAWGQGAYEVPYASGMADDADWTVVDVNKDGKTWASSTSTSYFSNLPYTTIIQYTYHSTNAANDWLIGPALHLEAGKEYKVKFQVHNSYKESLALMLAKGNTVDELSAGKELYKFEGVANVNSGKAVQITQVFTVDETGDYHMGFHCYSAKDLGWLRMSMFQVAENVFAPGPVTGLTCTPGADRALSATLKWTLPTTDSDGAPLPEGAVFDAIEISRDNVLVATIDGTATEWTDSEATGLTPGVHTYKVTAVVNGAKSAATSVESKYIGPVEAFALPYTLDTKTFTADDFELFWQVVAGRNTTSTNNWKHAGSSYSGYYIQFSPGSGKIQDNWLISPQMKFTEPGVYRLSVKLSYNTYPKADLDILVGKGTSIGGYEDVIVNLTDIPSADTEYSFYFEVAEPGEYGIAFHAKAQESGYYAYYLKQFAVEKWHITPAHVSDLKATVNDDATVSLSWTNPSVSNTGSQLQSLEKVELYCNDKLEQTFSDVTPGQAMTHVHTPAQGGVYTYYVLPYTAEGAADGEATKVTTTWVGDETQTLPYSTKFAATDATAPIWSSFDANGDDHTWKISTSGAAIAKPTETIKPDDYLLSPYFDLEPGYYAVNAGIKGAGKNAVIGIGLVSDKKDVAATYVQQGSTKLPGQSWETSYPYTLKVDKAGRYAVAFRFNDWMSSSDYALTVTKFDIAAKPVVPAVATDLTVTPAADLSLSATVTWTNPSTTNIEGVEPELVKAVILREDVEIGTVTEGLVPGQQSSYVDNEVPNAGEYTYTVVVYGTEGASTDEAPSVKSPWIGSGMDLPWNCNDGFRDAGWTIHNVNKDSNSWGEITWEASNSSISITSNNNTPDDWAITPRLNIPEGEYIVTVVSYYSSGYSAVSWDLWHGQSVDYNSMTTKIATINTANPSASRQTDKFRLVAVNAADPQLMADEAADTDNTDDLPKVTIPAGVGTIGLHANNKGAFSVSSFSVEKYNSTSVDDITVAKDGINLVGDMLELDREASRVNVYDLSGRVVLSRDNVQSLTLDNLKSGAYIIQATIDNRNINVKVIR